MADAHGSEPCSERIVGSTPAFGRNPQLLLWDFLYFIKNMLMWRREVVHLQGDQLCVVSLVLLETNLLLLK